MGVIIKQRGNKTFWTGSSWSNFRDASAVYDAGYAESIIAKRWPNGVKIYRRLDDGAIVLKEMAKLMVEEYRGARS